MKCSGLLGHHWNKYLLIENLVPSHTGKVFLCQVGTKNFEILQAVHRWMTTRERLVTFSLFDFCFLKDVFELPDDFDVVLSINIDNRDQRMGKLVSKPFAFLELATTLSSLSSEQGCSESSSCIRSWPCRTASSFSVILASTPAFRLRYSAFVMLAEVYFSYSRSLTPLSCSDCFCRSRIVSAHSEIADFSAC